LQDIESTDPEYVFLMGNSPLSGILGETGITNWNGVAVKRDNRTYVPLFHPAYILRNQNAMGEWVDAVLRIVEGENAEDQYEYVFPTTISEIYAMYKDLSDFDVVSYDVETSGLDAFDPEAVILSVSFGRFGMAYAFPLFHPEFIWPPESLKKVIEIIGKILAEHKIIGHNIKYDQQFTFATLGMWFVPYGDSMLVSHLVDSRKGIHGLKRLAGIHAGMYQYENELNMYKSEHREADPKRGGSYKNVPLKILLPYGAMDAEATWKVLDILYESLTDKQIHLYHELVMPASNMLCKMQCNGILVDEFIAKRYEQIYSIIHDETYEDLLKSTKVKKLVKILQSGSDRNVARDNDYQIIDDKIVFEEGDKTRRLKRRLVTFNPNSPLQLRELFFNLCKVPVLSYTKTGEPSTEGKAYKHLEDKYPILGGVRYYKLLTKMLSTYLSPAASGKWESGDGVIHTTFNLNGAITGRTSSSKPVNLQNIPTPEKEPGTLLEFLPVKNIFTHSYREYTADGKFIHDGRLVSMDYSGMELRVFASLARCEPMLKIHRSGKDFHKMVASMVSGIPYEEVDKPTRYIYKWTNWTLLYGGGASTLTSMYRIPIKQAEKAVHDYFEMFPEVREYQRELVAFAEDNGYVESPFGRREYLPYINDDDPKKCNKSRRECMNMPIQSAAGDTLLIAATIINILMERYQEDGVILRSKMVNEVHDSIVFDCPNDEIDTIVEISKDVMENISKFSKLYAPHIDFSWLRCPLIADAEVGTHYGSEISYEEWRKT